MRAVLCEKCFPDWENHPVYTYTPIGPCEDCGVWGGIGGAKLHFLVNRPTTASPECTKTALGTGAVTTGSAA